MNDLTNIDGFGGVSRRAMLQRCGMGVGALGLWSLLQQEGLAGTSTLSPKRPHFAPKAKSVIWIFANGGHSQVDTWDYKPALAKRDGQTLDGFDRFTGFFANAVGGLMKSPFEFRPHGQCGKHISSIFPNLSRHVDRMAFVHSGHTESNNHSPALFMMNCGLPRMGYPCVGSWVTYGPVCHPRTHTGIPHSRQTTVHHEQRGRMVVALRVTRVNECHPIHVPGEIRKNGGDVFAALAVRPELERAFHQATDGVGEEPSETVEAVERLAVALGQGRFVIPRIDLTMATVGKNPDYRLGLGRKMRPLGRQRARPSQALLLQQTPKPKRTHTHAAPLQHRTPAHSTESVYVRQIVHRLRLCCRQA